MWPRLKIRVCQNCEEKRLLFIFFIVWFEIVRGFTLKLEKDDAGLPLSKCQPKAIYPGGRWDYDRPEIL